jgi:hypothetical protein
MDFNYVVHQAKRMLIQWTPSNNVETLSYKMLQLLSERSVCQCKKTLELSMLSLYKNTFGRAYGNYFPKT